MVVVSLMKLPLSLQDQTQPPWIRAYGSTETETGKNKKLRRPKGREVNRLLFKKTIKKKNEEAASEGNRKSMERPERHRSMADIPNLQRNGFCCFF